MRPAIVFLVASIATMACTGDETRPTVDLDAVQTLDAPDASDPDATASDVPPDAALDAVRPGIPPPGFLDPVGAQSLVGTFLGRINTPEEASDTATTTSALGAFTLTVDGVRTTLAEGPVVFVYTYPDTPDVPQALRGAQRVYQQAYWVDPDSTLAHARYVLAQVVVPVEALVSVAEGAGGTGAVAHPDVRAIVRQIEAVVRPDRVRLDKRCYVAVHDPENPGSAVFVDGRANTDFAAGETLRAWSNVGLVTDHDGLASVLQSAGVQEFEGRFCDCVKQGAAIPCDQWAAEIVEEGLELSCAVPDDFDDDPAPSHMLFRFKGDIHAAGAETLASGAYLFDVVLDGESLPIDYTAYATRSTIAQGVYAGEGLIVIGGMGAIAEVAPGRYEYVYVDVQMLTDGLDALKADGEHRMFLDGRHIFQADVYRVEQFYETATSSWVKACPRAGLDVADPGSLWVCHEGNTGFAVGEPLEVAGNLALAPIAGGACYCSKDGEAKTCDEFPEAP